MPTDPLKIVSLAANALASSTSLRDGCGEALRQVAEGLGTALIFLARPSTDRGLADLVATNGLHAADFRRLESRLPKSGLWRILNAHTPFVIDDLTQDPILAFLAFASHAATLAAVPVGRGTGLLAAAFRDERPDEGRNLRVLETVASLIAHSMRVDQTVVSDNERLTVENRMLKSELRERYDLGNLIGNSGGMRQAMDQVRQIARSNTAVLLRGESGTGRDMFANAIRFNSLRSKRPFVKLDLTAIPPSEPVHELERRLIDAEGGTMFLDEVFAGPIDTQAQILDLIRRSTTATRDRPPRHNVRFIASTTRDPGTLPKEIIVAQLAAELSTHTIYLPPLRERRSDILLLADHFLEKFAAVQEKHILRISTPAIDMLAAYHFPGNVRELENVIEHAVTACDGNVVHGHHLPPTLQTAEVTGTETRITLESAVETFERDLIQDALKSARGNIAKAARMLDSTERIMGYKIKKYGLEPRRFRSWK
jgi:Nif-specific regulatory protein